jgi:HEAT repeat protein
MRRTAGDALSDFGDVRAVPPAATALKEDRSKLVQWRAARILGELGASLEVVGDLKQASFSDKYAFEVAFEIKDALRKVKARIQNQDNGSVNGEPNTGTGPVWKQIQQGIDSS